MAPKPRRFSLLPSSFKPWNLMKASWLKPSTEIPQSPDKSDPPLEPPTQQLQLHTEAVSNDNGHALPVEDTIPRRSSASLSSSSQRTSSDQFNDQQETLDFWINRLHEPAPAIPLTIEEIEEGLQCAQRIRAERDRQRTQARLDWHDYTSRMKAADSGVEQIDKLINEFITRALRSGMSSTTLNTIMTR